MKLSVDQAHSSMRSNRNSLVIAVENLRHIALCYGDGIAARVLYTACRRIESILPDSFGALTIEPSGLRIQGWGWDGEVEQTRVLPALLFLCEPPIDIGQTRISVAVSVNKTQCFPALDHKYGVTACFEQYRSDMEIAVVLYDALSSNRVNLVEYPLNAVESNARCPYHRIQLKNIRCGTRVIATENIPSVLERLRLTRAYDRYLVHATIDRLKTRPDTKLGCEVSALSAVDDIWWTSVRDELTRNPSIAGRLVIEIREASDPESRLQMTGFILAMQKLGCGVSFSGYGSGTACQR